MTLHLYLIAHVMDLIKIYEIGTCFNLQELNKYHF